MGIFKYKDDPLKHFVRTTAWLPRCQRRLKLVRAKRRKGGAGRRLRYFTFCAVHAVDVLMLDIAKVIRPADNGDFDTVVFFDRTELDVLETQKCIRGAHGYPGDFVEIVLAVDPEEAVLMDGLDVLAPPPIEQDNLATRERQRRQASRRDFIKEFPFDIINLDLEGYFFRRNDPFPGRMIASFRKLLDWQKLPINPGASREETLDGFSLMFTTKIGPPDLKEDYLQMLGDAIRTNVDRDPELGPILERRCGTVNATTIQAENFDCFFRIALPKLIMNLLMDKDWSVDTDTGINLYEIERMPPGQPSYKMLHVVLDVVRQLPREDHRAPGSGPAVDALNGYKVAARDVFERSEVRVTIDEIDEQRIPISLEKILARRRKYYPEAEEPE